MSAVLILQAAIDALEAKKTYTALDDALIGILYRGIVDDEDDAAGGWHDREALAVADAILATNANNQDA